MRSRRFLVLFAAVMAVLSLGGCGIMHAAKARLEPRDEFIAMRSQILYRPGSEDMARRLATALDESVRIVEEMHDEKFLTPPTIYVCDAECFSRFTAMHRSVPAGQFMNSIFMNEPVLRRKEEQFNMRPENFLVHELTHLLFYQHAGAIAYMRTPAWFREGWAVVVSEGAGAEACTSDEAARHLLAGSTFDPAEQGSLFQNKTAASYGLRYPVFYRQAGMFVAYLRALDRDAFLEGLHRLFQGDRFQESFAQAYSKPISAVWQEFEADIHR